MTKRSGEHVSSDRNPLLSRRQFNWLGFCASTLGGAVRYDAMYLTFRAQLFVWQAPNLCEKIARHKPASLGNIKNLVAKHSVSVTEIGDSEAKGWTDVDWNLTPPSRTFVSDLNHLCAVLSIPLPSHTTSRNAPYFESESRAESGRTIDQTIQQVRAYRQEALQWAPSDRKRILVVNAGGDDLLRLLAEHASPQGAHTIFDDFNNVLKPSLVPQYVQLFRETAALSDVPALQGLTQIYVTGLPDFGGSSLDVIHDVPWLRDIATAGCLYVNDAMLEATELVRNETNVGIDYVDTFEDPSGNAITIGPLHLTHAGYQGVGRNIEAATVGVIDGTIHNLYNACLQHGVFQAQ